MPLECLAQEPLGGRQVTLLAKPGFDRVTIAVDSTTKVFPLASDLDVGFIHVPFPADASFVTIEALEQLRRVADNPSVNSRMIDGDAALGHHLFQIPEAEVVC